MASISSDKPVSGHSRIRWLNPRRTRQAQLLGLVFPFMAFTFVFSYVPLLGWSYAFVDFVPGLSMLKQEFVGFRFFTMIFDGASNLWPVLRNTLTLSFLGILMAPIPVVFAVLLTQVSSSKLSRFVQTVTSIPNFISWILVYAIFFSLFSTEDGIVNLMLMRLGVITMPINLLGNGEYAWFIQTGIGLWKSTGWGAIIYFAAIAGIDQELFEAAVIDGAGRWGKIVHIIVPGIAPTFFVLLLLSISNMLSNGFEQYYVFQNPLTMGKLEVLDTYVYRVGLLQGEIAFSTAMGMFKSIISIILLTFANRASKLIRGESIF